VRPERSGVFPSAMMHGDASLGGEDASTSAQSLGGQQGPGIKEERRGRDGTNTPI